MYISSTSEALQIALYKCDYNDYQHMNATFKLHEEQPLTIPAASVNSRLHLLIRCNQIVMHHREILELWKYLKPANVSLYSLCTSTYCINIQEYSNSANHCQH